MYTIFQLIKIKTAEVPSRSLACLQGAVQYRIMQFYFSGKYHKYVIDYWHEFVNWMLRDLRITLNGLSSDKLQ